MNVVKFPEAPEWAKVDAELVEGLIAKGYLRRDQRHDWRAVQVALCNAFYVAVGGEAQAAINKFFHLD